MYEDTRQSAVYLEQLIAKSCRRIACADNDEYSDSFHIESVDRIKTHLASNKAAHANAFPPNTLISVSVFSNTTSEAVSPSD